MKTSLLRWTVAPALVAGSLSAGLAQDMTGAGATFPAPIYAKWADAYNKATGARLNYQSVGSGAGIQQIRPRPSTSARPTCR
jgi:phosphate transport system substrate-binding protein